MRIHPDGRFIDVKAVDENGNILDIKGITDEGMLDIKGIVSPVMSFISRPLVNPK